jgi:hypothetical protein
VHLEAEEIQLGQAHVLQVVLVVLAPQQPLLAGRLQGDELGEVVLLVPEEGTAVVGSGPEEPSV